MIALALTIAAVLGLSVVANTAETASIGFVLTATLLSLGLAPFVGDSLEHYILAAAWHRVSLSPTAYRRLGAPLYNPCSRPQAGIGSSTTWGGATVLPHPETLQRDRYEHQQ